MPQAQKSAVSARPEAASTFLTGYFFVPMPDFSDESVWTINQGRSMPALIAVIRALHDQHRRGRTPEIRADAAGGRLTIGLKALSRANGMQTSSLLRQLRFLERTGFLRAHDGERIVERHPKTGKILKGRGRTPPKVIVMTLDRSMMRGGRRAAETGRNPSQKPEETGRIPSLSHHALRDGKRPPSIEHPTKGVPMEHRESREHPALGGRNVPPPQADKQPAMTPSDPAAAPRSRGYAHQDDRPTAQQASDRWHRIDPVVAAVMADKAARKAAKAKQDAEQRRTQPAPVRPAGTILGGQERSPDKQADEDRQAANARTMELAAAMSARRRANEAAISARMKGLEALKEGERYIPSKSSAFDLRRQTTDSVTVCPSVAGEAAQALDGPPMSDEERRAIILSDLDAYGRQAGLTAGEDKCGAGAA